MAPAPVPLRVKIARAHRVLALQTAKRDLAAHVHVPRKAKTVRVAARVVKNLSVAKIALAVVPVAKNPLVVKTALAAPVSVPPKVKTALLEPHAPRKLSVVKIALAALVPVLPRVKTALLAHRVPALLLAVKTVPVALARVSLKVKIAPVAAPADAPLGMTRPPGPVANARMATVNRAPVVGQVAVPENHAPPVGTPPAGHHVLRSNGLLVKKALVAVPKLGLSLFLPRQSEELTSAPLIAPTSH